MSDGVPIDWVAGELHAQGARLWAMAADGTVAAVHEAAVPLQGQDDGALARGVAAVLDKAAAPRGSLPPVVLCGEGAAMSDWPAPRPLPATPLPERLATQDVAGLRLAVLPGLRQAQPLDVTEGEEARLAGCLAGQPDFDGAICVTGARSLWAHVSAGEVVSIQSFASGRLLRALTPAGTTGEAMPAHPSSRASRFAPDDEGFAAAFDVVRTRPERLASTLAGLEAAARHGGLAPKAHAAGLAGALVGAELAAARPWWLGRAVLVTDGGVLAQGVVDGLATQGVVASLLRDEAMLLAGLAGARALLRKR